MAEKLLAKPKVHGINVFLLFPASFFVTAIGHYVTDYWTEKVR